MTARNGTEVRTTATIHFLHPHAALRRGMGKDKKAADKAAVECVLRVVNKDGRTLIEIELDEKAALAIAAKLIRGARN